MPTSPTLITALPTPPSRNDSATFSARGDAFLGAFPTFRTETNAVATVTYNNAVEVASNTSTVAANTTLAQNAASSAAASAGASIWVSGTTYSIGDVRYSPANGQIYRRLTAGGGTTDPSADGTNWTNVFAFTFSGSNATLAGSLTLSGGTANGVLYLNGSKVATSGSALTFDGTNILTVGTATNKTTVITGGATGLTVAAAGAPAVAVWDTTDAGYVSYLGQINADTYFGNNANGALYFQTNASTKMTLDSSGNVGIGTSSPASQSTGQTTGILDVSASGGGNLVLHRTGSSDGALFSILKSSNGTYLDSTGAATAANNAIIFRNNNNNADQTTVTERARITSDGTFRTNTAGAQGIQLNTDTSNSVVSSRLFFTTSSGTNAFYGSAGHVFFNTGATIGFSTGSTSVVFNAYGVGVGAAVPSSGAGIAFPATQSASSDANTLDEYEEGTWTPTVSGSTSAGTGTYSAQVGRYVRIGKLVTATAQIIWSAHTGTGDLRFSGLPFTSDATVSFNPALSLGYVHNIALTANNLMTAIVINNATAINVYQYPVGGGAATAVPIDTAGQVIYTVSYEAA